jgi:LCP family protein required for cell wall assembly
VGGPAWNDPDAPTEVYRPYGGQPPRGDRYPDRPGGPPRGPVPPPRTGGPGGPGGPERRRRTPGAIIGGRIVATVLAVALVLVCGIAWATLGTEPSNASDATDKAGNVGVQQSTTNAQGQTVPVTIKGTNILVVGSDARTDASGNPLTPEELQAVATQLDGGGVNTDTIMILHIPDGGGKATAISIPRDTWMSESVVDAPGVVGPYSDGTEGPYKPNKINSFYGSAKAYYEQYLVSKGVTDKAQRERESNEAGRTMLIKGRQQFTGLKINHYAEVNLIGFYLMSKAIGGVPVCLLHATKDRMSGADFPAGHFQVSGTQALSFVRQRHGLPGGDLDRIRRQQAFLAGAADKILSLGTLSSPSKLSGLVDAANRSLVLDKGFDLLSFAQQMVGLTSGNINFVTIPTHGAAQGVGTDALGTDPSEIRSFFAQVAGENGKSDGGSRTSAAPTSVDPASVTVDVQNGTETSGMAASVGQKVADAGFQRGQLSDYPGTTADNQQAKTTVRYSSGGKAAAQRVLDVIGVGSLAEDDAVPDSHVLVVVGTDMPRPSGLHGAGGALLAPGSGSGSGSTGTGSGQPTGSGGAGAESGINAANPGCVN